MTETETRRVIAKGAIKHHPYYLDDGDAKTLPKDIADMFIANGWAEDAETGEIGDTNKPPATLDIHSGALGVTDTLEG